MSLFDRWRRSRPRLSRPIGNPAGTGSTSVRAAGNDDEQHLRQWIASRRGVEGFVEPRTAVSEVTLLLVAHDGEWTRRRVPSVRWAHTFANRLGVPSYDAAVVGVPQRMREWNARHKRSQRDALDRDLGEGLA